MANAVGARKMTEQEWLDLDEDEPGELVDFTLEDEEVPTIVHEILVLLLGQAIANWTNPRGGFVGGSEAKFLLRPGRGRKPDLFVYFPGSKKPPRSGAARTPPDLMIEVISPRARDMRRDRIEKMNDYARFGVRFYWLVDPEARTFEVFARNDDGAYVRALGAAEGTLAEIPGCEGLTLDLDAIWAKLDELPEGEEGGEA